MAKITMLIGYKNHFSEEAINEIVNTSEYPEITENSMATMNDTIDATLEGLRKRGYSYSSEVLNSGIEIFTCSINTSNYWKFMDDLMKIGMEIIGVDEDDEEDEDE